MRDGIVVGIFLLALFACYITFGYAAVDTLAPVVVYGFWPNFCGKVLLWGTVAGTLVKAFND